MAGPGMIDLANKSAWQNLAEIAKFAIGSKEATGDERVEFKGGAGRIGMIGGHVVKFNTHASERRSGPKADQAMRNSCNELRENLYRIAAKLGLDAKTLSGIRSKLGLNQDGRAPANTKLLDRKVVVSVINLIGKDAKFTDRRVDVWAKMDLRLNEIKEDLASTKRDPRTGKKKDVDTSFAAATSPAIAARAQAFLAKNGDGVREMSLVLADKMVKPKEKVPGETVTVLNSILRRSAEAVVAGKNDVSIRLLQGAGSTHEALVKLADAKRLTVTFAIFAQSLPPREANAFLRALVLIPAGDETGVPVRLHAAAAKLASLPEEKFTPENILKLAMPELPIPGEIKGKRTIAAADFAKFYDPIQKLLSGNVDRQVELEGRTDQQAVNELAARKHLDMFVRCGMSLKDIMACLANPARFSPRMLPPAALFSGQEVPFSVDDALEVFGKDAGRQSTLLKILGPDGKVTYEMPSVLREHRNGAAADEVALGELRQQIEDLCGKDNTAQQAHVLMAMTQNSEFGESISGVFAGYGNEGHVTPTFSLQKDERTGDVIMTRRASSDRDSGLLTVMRFGPDGTQKIESSVIEKGKRIALDVNKIVNGTLSESQLKALWENPTSTSGPVTIQYPEDFEKLKDSFATNYAKEKGQVHSEAPKMTTLGVFLTRNITFRVGNNDVIDYKDSVKNITDEKQRENKLNDLKKLFAEQINELVEDDSIFATLIDVCCAGQLTNPGSHTELPNNFNASFDLNKSDSYAQEIVFAKNKDGSVRVSVSAQASNIRSFVRIEAQKEGEGVQVMKTYNMKLDNPDGTPTNSLAYTFAFDVKMEADGPKVTSVDRKPSTLTFDFRGNAFSVTGYPPDAVNDAGRK